MLESPVVSIHIPPGLRALTGGNPEVTVSGETVGEALQALGNSWPGVSGALLRSNGQLRSAYTVLLGATDIHQLNGLGSPIGEAEVITILPCMAAVCAPTHGDISVG